MFMTDPRRKLFCLLLMMLMAMLVAGCGNESPAVEDFEEPLTVSSAAKKLPSWLLLEHRSEKLPDEDLGFVAIDSEYRVALEEENKAASLPTEKATSSGSSSVNSDDEWESSVTTPQQKSNSGSWWEQPFSSSSDSGQLVHKVRYDLED
jgi:hypothetical protein